MGNRISAADLGSGAGFPGLPIKLWAPSISMTLIEPNHKKAAFLREVTRALSLTNIGVQTARAESLAGVEYHLVTLRAVERFDKILPIARKLVAPGGRLALLVGSEQLDRVRLLMPPLCWTQPEKIPLSRSRIFAVGHDERARREDRSSLL